MNLLRTVVYFSFGTLAVASGVVYGVLKLMKQKAEFCTCKNRVKNKVVVITGANSGIGFETALQLAKYGAEVYLLCRDQSLGLQAVRKIYTFAEDSELHVVPVDLCNLESCNECITLVALNVSKIDILIHNAAVFCAQPKLTTDEFEIHFQTNFLAPVFLTQKLLPFLLEAPAPRVIFLNSEAHKLADLDKLLFENFSFLPDITKFESSIRHYGSTKLALKLYAHHLAETNKECNLIVTSVNPGNVWTNIYRRCFLGWFERPKRWLCSILMRSPFEGAQSVIHAANAPFLTSGSYISDCKEIFPFLSPEEKLVSTPLVDFAFEVLNL